MADFQKKIIVLSAKPWSFNDENNGMKKEGTTVEYVFVDDLAPQQSNDMKGIKVSKATMEFHDYASVIKAPAVYEAGFNFKPGSKGKIELALTSIEYAGLIEMKVKKD
jgi:hypothetical protein